MKKLLFVLFFLPLLATAQKTKEIRPVKMHTVGPKENLSSIGRLYEVNGRVLANYNNIDYDKGLTIGQVLKIPPKGTTLDQVTQNTPPKTDQPKTDQPVVKSEPKSIPPTESNPAPGTPVYHKVGKKETLYHITTLYPGTTVDDLKKWNNLTGDGVNEGANLIVGFKNGGDVKRTIEEKKEPQRPTATETLKREPAKEIKEQPMADNKPANTAGKNIIGGAFKPVYESQSGNNEVKEDGNFGVFKSTSGWKDGKYYCLYNNATPGTIIKVTVPATGKYVFAKVLDLVPDLKQNNGLLLLISNSAADELGVAVDGYAACSISYSK